MAEGTRIRCPKCGMLMNHHADKVDYSGDLDDREAVDSALGWVLKEVHQCPNPVCGWIELRPAASE